MIPTGLGYALALITPYSANNLMLGFGTVIEARVAYLKTKPIIILQSSGGTANRYQLKVIG